MTTPGRALDGRVAVVTGAARGIGRAIAELFLAEGASVVGGDAIAIDLAEPGFVGLACDVRDEREVKALVDLAASRFGGLDCIVNNAARPGAIDGLGELAPAVFDATVQAVLGSAFYGMHHAAPALRARGGGSIINIGSTSGLVAAAVLHDYGAAKAGLHMLTRSAAMELAGAGIRVNCLSPGGIATAFYGIAAGLGEGEAEARRAIVADNLGRAQPLGRAGTPEEVAQAALWLAGDASSYVTGQIIAVDGGMSVGRSLPPGITASRFFGHIAGMDAR